MSFARSGPRAGHGSCWHKDIALIAFTAKTPPMPHPVPIVLWETLPRIFGWFVIGSQERRPVMINILLSVRRPYSRYILNDEKHDEVRKTAPLKFKRGNTTIYLYESGKNGNHTIIGKCEMYGTSLVTESRGENAIRILAAQARVGFAELVNYLPCWDWGIGAPELFLNAVPLSAIGLTRPPQSWQYLTPEQASILERRGSDEIA